MWIGRTAAALRTALVARRRRGRAAGTRRAAPPAARAPAPSLMADPEAPTEVTPDRPAT